MAAIRTMPMTEMSKAMSDASLLRLMTWLSPVFPTGAFAWSGGLETACRDGWVKTESDLKSWIEDGLTRGAMRNDAILCAAAFKQDEDANDLALGLVGSRERFEETTALGQAFVAGAAVWRPGNAQDFPDPIALPVAVGLIAAEQELPLRATLVAYLQSATSNQIQAALRLMSLGQNAALMVTQELEEVLLKSVATACHSTLNDLGACTTMMEIASMRHETLSSRIFRS